MTAKKSARHPCAPTDERTTFPHMARTPTQRLADALLPEGLDRFVSERRLGAGMSWPRIALDLRDVTNGQVTVTAESLRAWYADEMREPQSVAS